MRSRPRQIPCFTVAGGFMMAPRERVRFMEKRLTVFRKDRGKGDSMLGGALSLTAAAIFVKVFGVLYKVPLSRILGDLGMGYFNTAYTVYAFFYLLCTAGVPKAVSLMTAEWTERGTLGDEMRLLKRCLMLFAGIGAVFSVFLFTGARYICRAVGSPEAFGTLMTVAPAVIFISLSGVLRGYLNGRARLVPAAVAELIEGACKLVLGLFFAILAARQGLPLPLISAATIAGLTFGSFFGVLFLYVVVKKQISEEKTEQNSNPVLKEQGVLRKILRIVLPVTAGAVVMSVCNIFDLLLVMRRLSTMGYTAAEASAKYGNYTTLAVPMFGLGATLAAAVATATLPRLKSADVLGDTRAYGEAFSRGLSLAGFFSAALFGGFLFFPEEILSLLFERGAAQRAAPLLALLSFAVVLLGALTLYNTALEAKGHVYVPLLSMGVGSVVKLAVSYFLVGDPAWGIAGAPMGTVACYAVALVVSLITSSRHGILSAGQLRMFTSPILAALTSAALSRLLLSVLQRMLPPAPATVFAGIGFGLFYLILAVLLGFFPKRTPMVSSI